MKRKHLILSGILLLTFGLHLIYYSRWTHDDPFITFRYVRNIAAGKGFVFNEGVRLEGYSNFLFLILLAPFEIINFPLPGAAKILGFLFSLGTLFLFITFLRKYYREERWYHYLAAFLVAMSADATLWAVSGMETALSMFFAGAAWIFFSREVRMKGEGVPWSSLFLLGAALNRPEGLIYFIALGACGIYFAFKKQISLKYLIFWGALFCIPFGFYNSWRVIYFGDIFPNTYYAKATGPVISRISRGIQYLFDFIIRNPYLFLLPFTFPFLSKKPNPEKTSATAMVLAQIFFILHSGGDWMPLSRFMVPVLLPLFFLSGEGVIITCKLFSEKGKQKIDDILVTVFVFLVILTVALNLKATWPLVYSVRTETLYKPHIRIGLWMKENFPEDSLLAGEEAGIIPYYSELRFLDLLGIVDPYIARQEGEMHYKFDLDYVLSKKPDYALLYTVNAYNSEKGEEALEPRIEPGMQLLSSGEFLKKYDPAISFQHGNDLIGKDYLTLFVREGAFSPARRRP